MFISIWHLFSYQIIWLWWLTIVVECLNQTGNTLLSIGAKKKKEKKKNRQEKPDKNVEERERKKSYFPVNSWTCFRYKHAVKHMRKGSMSWNGMETAICGLKVLSKTIKYILIVFITASKPQIVYKIVNYSSFLTHRNPETESKLLENTWSNL